MFEFLNGGNITVFNLEYINQCVFSILSSRSDTTIYCPPGASWTSSFSDRSKLGMYTDRLLYANLFLWQSTLFY